MQTIFRVSEASAYFDNMQTYEARKERAELVRDKLRKVFPGAYINASNLPNEGDPEVIRMIEKEMKAILNLLPE